MTIIDILANIAIVTIYGAVIALSLVCIAALGAVLCEMWDDTP